ncbi:MAG: hypothetical protein A2836_00910 [Candidatus Taylorbacteria bacterium RIFCSPHIGHO2_01_FULL_45_63]|uniref:EamA domain-containing protein n=1 Tax=Candidatus Taylorbacteria bacterium RIFCSPHIGHO2_02_FULL_45_35 TaxID=1802311 RepID=A0A1G2MX87_9BACT|nr:MAG: hypothetical protein A2836_00910 [Candidatus Taylorbacteria bacterium RIFCSPHIGHO2_01_FULL_45_63]OHA27799.1 MAG: hypothetical protein A3D56_03995 [Candidatus Taylorbacteria bacterium RIFCSPHIGHO2_02_FULL_45_35]OHA34092.1 MAG: hypothetical protein A3A22_02400 [Candidatus Taylorbacteria bacterium RIFCSPLOWO2_01_FULL_45_34b]
MQRWTRWTALEGGAKVVVRVLQKVLGDATTTLGGVMSVIVLMGSAQFLIGMVGLWRLRGVVTSDRRGKIGSILFGISSVFCNICALEAFQYGGSIIVITFITTLSIVPGAFLDCLWFGHKITKRQWCGISIGLYAGYAILGFPSFREAAKFPLWVWLAFGNMAGLVLNQWIVQSIKEIHPYAKNVWGGGATVALALLIMVFSPEWARFTIPLWLLSAVSLCSGAVTFFMWSFSLYAYKEGAFISLKKLLVNSMFLTMTVVVGIFFFGETFTTSHLVGFLLYLFALMLMDEKTWEFVRKKGLQFLAASRSV